MPPVVPSPLEILVSGSSPKEKPMPDFTPRRLTPEQIREVGAQGLAQCEALELDRHLNYGMARAQREWLAAEIERLAAAAESAEPEGKLQP